MTDLTQLKTLEPLAWRAPSAHNTQPWQLAYSDDAILLSFDPARELIASDPERRDLLLSLGAFVEAMLIAAADHQVPLGFNAEIDFSRCQIGQFRVASKLYDSPFTATDLLTRQTSRLPYEVGVVESTVIAQLRDGLGDGMTLHRLDTRDLVPLMTAANRAMLSSVAIVGELRRWLRLTGRAQRVSHDGLSAQCLALARPEALAVKFALSRPIHPLLCSLGLHRLLARQAASVLKSANNVLILSQRIGTALETLCAGRNLLRIWMHLARHGYFTHPLSEIIDDRATYGTLASMLRLDDRQRILSVFRVGRSLPPPRSRRLR